MNKMAYDVSFTAPNNKLNANSLLGYIWYQYSNIRWRCGYAFDYDIGLCL